MRKGMYFSVGLLLGAVVGGGSIYYWKNRIHKLEQKKVVKFRGYYNLLLQWLSLKQETGSIEKYFLENNYHNIIIYGIGELGNRLYEELQNTSIKVECAIDQNAYNTSSEINIISINDEIPEADVIVVTPIHDYDNIEEELAFKVTCPIISLEELLYNI